MTNLQYHFQPVIHSKNSLVLHEAFSTRSGELYSVNPLPVEVKGDTEEEMEETLRAMEVDSSKYKPIKYSKAVKEMERWVDEVQIDVEIVIPQYDDETDLSEDFYKESGEVLDICEFMDKNK